jgi:serine/threonine protein kinase
MQRESFVDRVGAGEGPPSDPFEARVGSVLGGKWTLTRLIGVGGMAAVYEATHELGRREAVKILHPEVARHEELRARFAQEARAVHRIKHPGVIDVTDVGTTQDGCPFLVMELCQGSSLADLLLRHEVSREQGLDYVDQVLDVLALAHEAGIVHRDIKPDNLFVLPDGRIKVLDFGIARVRHGTAAMVKTRTGTALGTPQYMPPEQIKGVDVDHRADLFAVGAILWELLTGRDVHPSSSTQQLMLMMLTTPAEPLAKVASDVPEPLCRVVDRALAFESFDRYPDARTMQADLREARLGHAPPFAAGLVPASAGPRATVASTPQSLSRAAPATTLAGPAPAAGDRSTSRIVAAVIVVGVLVGGLVTFVLLPDAPETSSEELFPSARSRPGRVDAPGPEPRPEASSPTPAASVSPAPAPSTAPIEPSSTPSSEPKVEPSSLPSAGPSAEPWQPPPIPSFDPPRPKPDKGRDRQKKKKKGRGD